MSGTRPQIIRPSDFQLDGFFFNDLVQVARMLIRDFSIFPIHSVSFRFSECPTDFLRTNFASEETDSFTLTRGIISRVFYCIKKV